MTYDKIEDTIAHKFHSLVVFTGHAVVPLLLGIGMVYECLIKLEKLAYIGDVQLDQGIVQEFQQLLPATIIHH